MADHENLFHVVDADFETQCLNPMFLLLDFWATWCPPGAIAPIYEKLSDEYKGKVAFAKMDTDQNERTPMTYGIQAIPTMIVFKNGKEVDRVLGADPASLKKKPRKSRQIQRAVMHKL